MRLIDADEFKKELYQQWFIDILLTQRNSEDMFYALAQKIDEQPTAYDVDKVVEQLEELGQKMSESKSIQKYGESSPANHRYYKAVSVKRAIEIVKGGGVDG